jgi:hypothetical protein
MVINFAVRKASLAVLDFRAGNGVSAPFAAATTEVLKSYVLKTDFFDIIERERG